MHSRWKYSSIKSLLLVMNSRYLPLLKNYRQEEGNEVPPTASVSSNQLRGDGPSLGGFITSHRADQCFVTHGAHHWSSLYFHDSHWTTSHRKPILHLTSCVFKCICTEICRLYLLDPRFAWLKAAVTGNHRSWSYQRLSSDIHLILGTNKWEWVWSSAWAESSPPSLHSSDHRSVPHCCVGGW